MAFRVSDLPPAEPLGPGDLFHVVQGHDPDAGEMGESRRVPFEAVRDLSRPGLILVTEDITAGDEGGFMVVPPGPAATVKIALPPAMTHAGREYQFVLAGPGTLRVAADPGDDAALIMVNGPSAAAMNSAGIGTTFRLRSVIVPSPGVSGWYFTCC